MSAESAVRLSIRLSTDLAPGAGPYSIPRPSGTPRISNCAPSCRSAASIANSRSSAQPSAVMSPRYRTSARASRRACWSASPLPSASLLTYAGFGQSAPQPQSPIGPGRRRAPDRADNLEHRRRVLRLPHPHAPRPAPVDAPILAHPSLDGAQGVTHGHLRIGALSARRRPHDPLGRHTSSQGHSLPPLWPSVHQRPPPLRLVPRLPPPRPTYEKKEL